MYSYAVRFIEQHQIIEIQPKFCPISPEEYLTAFYYMGLVYIGVKDYELAIYYLTEVVLTAADSVSCIVVEAVKKLKLLTLIEYGTEFVLPEYVPSTVFL